MIRYLIICAVNACSVLAMVGCGGGDGPAAVPAADTPAPTVAATLGSVTARPEAGDADTSFEVRTAALGRSYFGFHILLSDLADEEVGSSGKWARLSSELEPPYHRLAITVAELPSETGEVAATRLEYSLQDAAAGPFNYGWTELEGPVVFEQVADIVEVKEGLVPGARIVGSFDLTNNRGGHFLGRFVIGPL